MKAIFSYLIFITPLWGFSQLHHQMISSQGSTNITEGIVVTQTIGQQSIIGNSEVAGLAFGQGFQQSIWTRLINSNDQNFMAEYYPNPFFDQVTFRFTNMSDEIITIDIFDVAGKQVYSKRKNVIEDKLILQLGNLSDGSYLVRLYNEKKIFYTKLIKKWKK
jgi:hypothetical protein